MQINSKHTNRENKDFPRSRSRSINRNKRNRRRSRSSRPRNGQCYENTIDQNNQNNKSDLSNESKKYEIPNSPTVKLETSYFPSIKCDPVVLKESEKPGSQKLDYFAQLRAAGNSTVLNLLEKATIYATQYLAMDPIEKMKRQVEQTIEAKLGLLKTKLHNANDPKNKTQRKIYVGNLTTNINGEFLKQLFTQTLLISYPQWNTPEQDCVVEVQYRDGCKYCFLELRTMEMAMIALQVNGVTVLGTQLHVSRPTGFLDPLECEKAVKEAEQELTRIRTGEDDGVLLNQIGYVELVAKVKRQQLEMRQSSNKVRAALTESSRCLSFEGIVTVSSLESTEEAKELYEAVQDKVKEYGSIKRMIIPRPPLGIPEVEFFGKGYYGKVLVQFDQSEAASRARRGLDGVIFEGRTITIQTITEVDFSIALGVSD